MNAIEMEKALVDDAKICDLFDSVYASDRLPTVEEYTASYEANRDPPLQTLVGFLFHRNCTLEAFNPFGKNPSTYYERIKRRLGHDQAAPSCAGPQDEDFIECGFYCRFYVSMRIYAYSLEEVISASVTPGHQWALCLQVHQQICQDVNSGLASSFYIAVVD